MKFLIQRVNHAEVTVDGEVKGAIQKGLLVFVGVSGSDKKEIADKYVKKLINLRIFEDENEKMNFSVKDVGGEVLVVSQFTLCGDCKKGTRPSFDKSAPLDIAVDLYEKFTEFVRLHGLKTETGKFRAMMDVELINDGPVTFMLEK